MDELWRLPFAVGRVGDDWPIYNADGRYVAVAFDDDRREVLMPGTPEHQLAARIVAAVNHADDMAVMDGFLLRQQADEALTRLLPLVNWQQDAATQPDMSERQICRRLGLNQKTLWGWRARGARTEE